MFTLRDLEQVAVRACRDACHIRTRAYGANDGGAYSSHPSTSVQVSVIVHSPGSPRRVTRRYREVRPGLIRYMSRTEARAMVQEGR